MEAVARAERGRRGEERFKAKQEEAKKRPEIPATPMEEEEKEHGTMTPIATTFPEIPSPELTEAQKAALRQELGIADRDVDNLREKARRMMGGQPVSHSAFAGPNPYATRKSVTRRSDEEKIKDMERQARQQTFGNVSRTVSPTAEKGVRTQGQSQASVGESFAIQRLSKARGNKAKWARKSPSEKLRMLISGGIYGVYDLVIQNAGDVKANGVYEPAQPYNNRPQWKRNGWSLYWRDTSKGRRKGGEWVIQADHTYQYRCTADDSIPPTNSKWLKVKGRAPGPSISYRERKQPKQLDI